MIAVGAVSFVLGFGLCAVLVRVGGPRFLAEFCKARILETLRTAAAQLEEMRVHGVAFEDALTMMRQVVDELEADEILDVKVAVKARPS